MQYVAYRHVPLNDRTLIQITSFTGSGVSSRDFFASKRDFHSWPCPNVLAPLHFSHNFSPPPVRGGGGTYKANFCDRTERTTKSGKGFGFLTAIPFKLGTLPCLSKCKAVRLHLRSCGGAEIRMNGAPDLVYAAEVNRPFSRKLNQIMAHSRFTPRLPRP